MLRMAESLTIGAGIVTLLSCVTALSIRANEFRQDFYEARFELDKLTKILADLSLILGKIHDAHQALSLPNNLSKDLGSIIESCRRTVVEAENHLEKSSTRKLRAAVWAFSGKKQCLEICRRIEAHSRTLNMAWILDSAISNRSIQDRTDQILSEVRAIRLGEDNSPEENYVLQRFLQDTEEYTSVIESQCGGSTRGAEDEEHQGEEQETAANSTVIPDTQHEFEESSEFLDTPTNKNRYLDYQAHNYPSDILSAQIKAVSRDGTKLALLTASPQFSHAQTPDRWSIIIQSTNLPSPDRTTFPLVIHDDRYGGIPVSQIHAVAFLDNAILVAYAKRFGSHQDSPSLQTQSENTPSEQTYHEIGGEVLVWWFTKNEKEGPRLVSRAQLPEKYRNLLVSPKFSPDGALLLLQRSALNDEKQQKSYVGLWDVEGTCELLDVEIPETHTSQTRVNCSRDGSQLAISASSSKDVIIINTDDGSRKVWSPPPEVVVDSMTPYLFSPNLKTLLIMLQNEQGSCVFNMFNLETQEYLISFQSRGLRPSEVVFSPYQDIVLLKGEGIIDGIKINDMKILSTKTGETLAYLTLPQKLRRAEQAPRPVLANYGHQVMVFNNALREWYVWDITEI